MKKTDLKQRIFDTNSFYRHLKNMMESVNDFIRCKLSGKMDGSFSEKIMLAVTEVNDCRYCSYLHTRLAVKAGVSEEEI